MARRIEVTVWEYPGGAARYWPQSGWVARWTLLLREGARFESRPDSGPVAIDPGFGACTATELLSAARDGDGVDVLEGYEDDGWEHEPGVTARN